MRLINKIARLSTIHDEDGAGTFKQALAEGMRPDPSLPLDEWSDQYMIIPRSTGAAEYGKYRVDRTPHGREIMRCLSVRHPSRRVVLMAASQMLKTQIALNWFCYIVHQHPANVVWLMPTGKLHKRIVQRIDRNIAAVEVVRQRVSPPGSRLATNSQDIKVFSGGTLYIATAGSAANLAEVPARFISFDEIDRAELSVDGEGDPVKLAEARQTTFSDSAKSYYYSSPTIEGESRIASLYDEGTQREALAECIHCGHAQPLLFESLIRLESGDAVYPCKECGGLHKESDKSRMFSKGLWSDAKQSSTTESFTISAMFQPYGWLSWTDLMNQHDEAYSMLHEKSMEEQMIVFYNTRLARVWKRTTDVANHAAIRDRAADYRKRVAPNDVLLITAGVDTQDNRLAVHVVGWGKNLKAWALDYIELFGDPQDGEVWDQLTRMINAGIERADGYVLPIRATGIDTGGHRGEAVKNYVRSRRIPCPVALHGSTRVNAQPLSKGSMQDVTWKGVLDKKGIVLHAVGTVEIKNVIFSRIIRDAHKEEGERMLNFSKDFDENYFAGIASETYNRQKRRYEKKPGVRNEQLDTLVYAYSVLHHPSIRAHRMTAKDWDELAKNIGAVALKKEQAHNDPVKPKISNASLRERARERRERRRV